jgi:hypothetical protein
MNGNITKEGIKADRRGAQHSPNRREGLVYMTPEWKDAFQYAATLADHWAGDGHRLLAGME